MSELTTWRNLIDEHLRDHPGESVIESTLSDGDLDREFDCGYGGSCGEWFTAWTENRVLFPVVYDGAEWVGSAPRNPCDEETQHVGGQ